MLIIGRCREQAASRVQRSANGAVRRVEFGVDDAAFTAEPEPISAIFAVAFDREHRVDSVCLAQVKVILAMIGRHMDEAGAAISGDEVACEHWARFRKETAEMVHWVADDGPLKLASFNLL